MVFDANGKITEENAPLLDNCFARFNEDHIAGRLFISETGNRVASACIENFLGMGNSGLPRLLYPAEAAKFPMEGLCSAKTPFRNVKGMAPGLA